MNLRKKPRRVLQGERLDERILLAFDSVYVSEFLANNDTVLSDQDGQFSDWIELHNPTTESIDLSGWSLTDSDDELAKWKLPSVTIPADGFQIVFASSKNRSDPNHELHTNFKLSSTGEYLALVKPDQTIAHEFAPTYPVQTSDVSFGFANLGASLFDTDSVRTFRIPTSSDTSDAWQDISYDDSEWRQGSGAIGYDHRSQNAGFEGETLLPWTGRGTVFTAGSLLGIEPTEGQQMAVASTFESAATRAATEFYLGMQRGSLDTVNNGDVQRVAALRREVEVGAGSTLSLDWNFLTNDLRDGDFAFAFVSDSDTIFPLADPTFNLVDSFSNDYERESGFQEFTHVFSEGGTYTIGIGVAQAIDLEFDSAILVDNLRIDGIGEAAESFDSVIQTEITEQITTIHSRQEFAFEPDQQLTGVELRVLSDDGFAAFVNGSLVAAVNAPDELTWNSTASDSRPDDKPLDYDKFEIPIQRLQPGANVLSIVGINAESDLRDFLMDAQFVGYCAVSDVATYLNEPTPGRHNLSSSSNVRVEFAETVTFDNVAGFYDSPFLLGMSTDSIAQIRFTTDGSKPTDENGTTYTQPIPIQSTTIVRAIAVKDGMLSRETKTASFLFLDDIVTQSTESAIQSGFPSTWDDYELDRDVIGKNGQDLFDGKYAATIRDDLLSLPSISLVMDRDDWFASDGLFSNPRETGREAEREASVELLNADGNEGFHVDAGLRIHGGLSRSSDKPSMRLLFRSDYGNTKLQYPLFGEGGPNEFDSLVMRSSGSEIKIGLHYIRDETARQLEQATGNPSVHGRFVHIYVNGLYWGVYNLMERIDAQFAVHRDGGEKQAYDVISAGEPSLYVANNGTTESWLELVLRTKNLSRLPNEASKTAAFLELQGLNPDGTPNPDQESYLDVDNFINYLVVNAYIGNTDCPMHNFYMYRKRGPDSEGFKFPIWDAEFSFERSTPRIISELHEGPTAILPPLLSSEAFRVQFTDRVHELVSPGGALYVNPESPAWDPEHPENNEPARIYAEIADSVGSGIVAESARWGDGDFHRPLRTDETPFTRDEDWLPVVQDKLTNFFPQRTDALLESLRADDLYRNPPKFGLSPGRVNQGTMLVLESRFGEAIYYTTDGSDPRMADGDISPTAIRYQEPITIVERTTIRARSLNDSKWSAIDDAVYLIDEVPASSKNLRISEINFNPHQALTEFGELDADSDRFEFIELVNVGDEAIDLTGVQLVSQFEHGVDFEFGQQSLHEGQRVVTPRDIEAFQSRFGMSVNLAVGVESDLSEWAYSGELDNGSDFLKLVGANGRTIQEFSFGDSDPSRADGNGSSLELIDPSLDSSDPGSRRPSIQFGGSPGTAGNEIGHTVVINEILANPVRGESDFIELYNPSTEPIDIQNWYLSDNEGDSFKFQVLQPTVIPPRGYHVFTDVDLGFGLSVSGEELLLIEADSVGRPLRYSDFVEFGSTVRGISLGRMFVGEGDLRPLKRPSPGAANPNDGFIDVRDIDLLCQTIRGARHDPVSDWNGDGQVSEADLEYLLASILRTGSGDANLDGRFSSSDLVHIFQSDEYEDAISTNSTWNEGDWNCDGDFDSRDLVQAFQRRTYESN